MNIEGTFYLFIFGLSFYLKDHNGSVDFILKELNISMI